MRDSGDSPDSNGLSGQFEATTAPSTGRKKARLPSPFSLRLTFEERAALEQAAAGMSLGEYVRSRVFDETVPARRTRGKHPVKDHEALGRVLGELGRSRLANNLNQLARAVNTGSLPVTPDTEAALLEACAEIQQIRAELVKALGLSPEPPSMEDGP
ncbi:MAG: plasmid mobilization relaxosome protein MobC [Alphaproteobacteria bacterium]|nr:plasmid mobilization relaxosome protein MobC [Alphaproteobacteria bacterium]